MMKWIQMNKSLFLMLIGFIPIFFVSAAYGSIEYRVKKGDNLYDIAKKYHISVKEIKKANKLSSNKLKPGRKITLPVKENLKKQVKTGHDYKQVISSSSRPLKGIKTAAEKNRTQTSSSSEDLLYHTVKKGETISAIAKKYSLTVLEVKELNDLKSSRLKKGQKLLVKRTGPRTYKVRKGDNIWKIAKRFDISGEELMAMNDMENPSLRTGQVIYLEEKALPDEAEISKETLARDLEEELAKMAETQEPTDKDKPGRLIEFAKKLMNIPYKFGGNSIFGIDCSAYVKKVYGLLGVDLPRTAREQYTEGESVEKNDLSIGDLVFFRTYASFPSHVGIYLGNNLFIHASSRGKKVTIDNLETPYYLKRFLGGKRLLKEESRNTDNKG